jgi:hypothetical protein
VSQDRNAQDVITAHAFGPAAEREQPNGHSRTAGRAGRWDQVLGIIVSLLPAGPLRVVIGGGDRPLAPACADATWRLIQLLAILGLICNVKQPKTTIYFADKQ